MNKARRKSLEEISARLDELKSDLENLKGEEEEYKDNMPENLSGSERYEKADESCNNLELAFDSLDEVISYIESACE